MNVAEKSEREYAIDRQKSRKILHFPPWPNWDLARALACCYRYRFRHLATAQENLVLLKKILCVKTGCALIEWSLIAWRWNFPFNTQMFNFATILFGYVAMQVRCLGSWWNPETRVFAWNLRYLSPHKRNGISFFICFFDRIESALQPSFSFTQADWLCGNTNCVSGLWWYPKT